jgi:hypothetical protein
MKNLKNRFIKWLTNKLWELLLRNKVAPDLNETFIRAVAPYLPIVNPAYRTAEYKYGLRDGKIVACKVKPMSFYEVVGDSLEDEQFLSESIAIPLPYEPIAIDGAFPTKGNHVDEYGMIIPIPPLLFPEPGRGKGRLKVRAK